MLSANRLQTAAPHVQLAFFSTVDIRFNELIGYDRRLSGIVFARPRALRYEFW